MTCGCRRLNAAFGCRYLGAMCDCIILVRGFVLLRHGTMFICVWTIQTGKIYLIRDKKSNQWSSIYLKTGVIYIMVTIIISSV